MMSKENSKYVVNSEYTLTYESVNCLIGRYNTGDRASGLLASHSPPVFDRLFGFFPLSVVNEAGVRV